MQTDDLISLMTAGHRPVDTGWLRRVTWLCTLAALAVTALLVLLVLGARRDLAVAWLTVPVIAKVLLGASVAGIALSLFQRSLRPGLRPRRFLPLVALPIVAVVGWAALTLLRAPVEQWGMLIFGSYWRACLIAIPLYALLPLAILFGLARRGAPVDGTLTGACAGLASAGLATIAYSLHCPDDTAPFLATWYTLAIAAVTAIGAVTFARLPRW